jgi:hypothetical protein
MVGRRGHRVHLRRAAVALLAVALLAVGCGGPSRPDVSADASRSSAPATGTDGDTSTPPDGSAAAPTGGRAGASTDESDGASPDAGGGTARSRAGQTARGTDGGGATAGSTRGEGATAAGTGGGGTGTDPTRSRERPSSSPSRSSGPTTVAAPLEIPPFNQSQGLRWTELESYFRSEIARVCGEHGPECVTLAVAIEDSDFFVADDCVLFTIRHPVPLYTGDTITPVIEDECGDGQPGPNLELDTSGLEGPSWSVVDPAGPQPGAPDCAVRFIRVPTYLYAEDRPQTPERDDLIEVALADVCGPG